MLTPAGVLQQLRPPPAGSDGSLPPPSSAGGWQLLADEAIPRLAVQCFDAQREPSPRPHFLSHWLLAEGRYGREATATRLEQLAAVEKEALDGPRADPAQVRMPSVGVELGREA